MRIAVVTAIEARTLNTATAIPTPKLSNAISV